MNAARRLARRMPTPFKRALWVLLGLRRRAASGLGSSGGSARRRHELISALARLQLPGPSLPPDAVRARVAAEPWLAAQLRLLWHQLPLLDPTPTGTDGGAQVVPAPVDLVLLQWHEGEVPGHDAAEVTAAVHRARESGVPVVVWATGSRREPWPQDGPVLLADHVWCDDAGTAERWSAARGGEVGVLAPAAHPLVHTPARVPDLPKQRAAAVVVADLDHLVPLSWLKPDEVDVWLPPGTSLREVPSSVPDDGTRLDRDPATALEVPTGPDEESEEQLRTRRLGLMRSRSVMAASLRGTGRTLGGYSVVTALGGAPGTPWPLVEAAMSGAPLVVDEASAALLPDDLRAAATVAADEEEVRYDTAARLWQLELRDREGLVLARAARAGHSLVDRVDRLLEPVTGRAATRDRSVSVVVPTNRPHELPTVAANVARQAAHERGEVQLVLVLHGLDLPDAQVRAQLADAGVPDVTIVRAGAELTLGACMNLGVDASDGRYVAKVDDDNHYGRHYLTDLVDAFDCSGAQIVGKWAHYVWLRSSGAVVLRNPGSQHRPERLVQGGSIVFDAEALRELRFGDLPRAVDTDILNRALEAGMTTYSADRFNFVSIRGTDRFAHTWPIADTALMNRSGRLVFFGDPRQHVDV